MTVPEIAYTGSKFSWIIIPAIATDQFNFDWYVKMIIEGLGSQM